MPISPGQKLVPKAPGGTTNNPLPGAGLQGSCESIRQLADFIKGLNIPGLTISSAKRSGDPASSLHNKGQALDISGNGAAMCALTNKMNQTAGSLAELIHSDPNCIGSVKDGKGQPPSFWGATTWGQHGDHVHIAVPNCDSWAGGKGLNDLPFAAPGGLFGEWVDLIRKIVALMETLRKKDFWLRVGMIVLGGVFIVVGILLIKHESVQPRKVAQRFGLPTTLAGVQRERARSERRGQTEMAAKWKAAGHRAKEEQKTKDTEEYARYQSQGGGRKVGPERAPGETKREYSETRSVSSTRMNRAR